MKPFISAGFLITVLATACSPTPEMIQTAIAQTQAAYTPTPEQTATQTDIPGESWRVPPVVDGVELGYLPDTRSDPELDQAMAKFADQLNIKEPYRWDGYSLPDGYTFKEVSFYYTRKLRSRGYSIDYNNYDPERKMGWMFYSTPTQTIYLIVYEDLKIVHVFYKNVEP
ncbi:MAG: hypothetical protein GYA15_16350 [Leptolinea sp.]|jgi:hypothetical protein|nr:hypothetical protein [Leptolinea sp.]